MNTKLVMVTLAVIGIAIFIRTRTADEGDDLEFRKLSERIELPSVEGLILREGSTVTELKDKGEGRWVVASRDGYPADPKKVTEVINELTQSRILHRVTRLAKNHQRLGLLDPAEAKPDTAGAASSSGIATTTAAADSPDGTDDAGRDADPGQAKVVTFLMKGSLEKRLLIANPDPDDRARSSTSGTNVRFADETAVYRLAKLPWITYEPTSWLSRDLLGITKDKVKSVQVEARSTAPIQLHRDNIEEGFALDGLASEEKVNAGAANRLADALASFRINDVQPATAPTTSVGMDGKDRVRFELFDGRTYEILLGDPVKSDKGEKAYAKLAVTITDNVTDTKLLEEVKDQSDQFGRWTYEIGTWIRSTLVKPRGELVEAKKPPAPATPAGSGTAAGTEPDGDDEPDGDSGEESAEVGPGAGAEHSHDHEHDHSHEGGAQSDTPGVGPGSGEPASGTGTGTSGESATAPGAIEARHILLSWQGAGSAGATRSKEEARTLAEEIHAKLQDGAEFAALAREHSDDGSRADGGNLGSFGRGTMVPPFETAAFALGVGEISEPVESEFGFHIIQRTK